MTTTTTAYETIAIEGFIVNETFVVTPSHCRFQLEEIRFLEPVLHQSSLDPHLLPTTEIVYWGELANFTTALRYKVEIRNARLRKFRDKLQYNTDLGSLLVISKQLKQTDATASSSPVRVAINTSLCEILEVKDLRITERFNLMLSKYQVDTYADLMEQIPTVRQIIPAKKEDLFDHLLETHKHLHAYCYLHHWNISPPKEDDSATTIELASIIRTNPFLVMTKQYGKFDEYEIFKYDRLESIAEEILGVRKIATDTSIKRAKAVAATIDLLKDQETQGHSWTCLEQIERLLCNKLKQPLYAIRELLGPEYEAIQFLIVADQKDKQPFSPVLLLQSPETKEKETHLLAWFDFLKRKRPTRLRTIDEDLLETVLSRIYPVGQPRDFHQVNAIRTALTEPVSCLSGPPGCGKTTFVVRAIVQYIEEQNEKLKMIHEKHHKDRCESDEELVQKELAAYVQRMKRSFYIFGNMEEEEGKPITSSFADQFEELLELTDAGGGYKSQRMHVRNLYQMTAQKLFELKYKKYSRLQSSKDMSMAKLVAPSGVAARRLSDACEGHLAHTCCSLIGQLEEDNKKEDPGFKDFYPFKLLLVDEASMVDLDMIYQIVKIVEREKVQLVFVGDPHQLPPIGIGQFFRDVLMTSRLPHVALERIYRQGLGSNIAQLSKAIVAGEDVSIPLLEERAKHLVLNDLSFGPSVIDSFFASFGETTSWDILQVTFPKNGSEDWAPIIARIYSYLLAQQDYQLNHVKVLTPFRDGNGGRHPINEMLQKEIIQVRLLRNANQPIDQQTYRRFQTYDPVIHRKNVRKLNIYNGDLGYVLPSGSCPANEKALAVQFPHQRLSYTPSGNTKEQIAQLKDLELAYAMTGHSAQGSQFPYVIVVLPRFVPQFTTSLMINTLISRAKTRLILLSEEEILQTCLQAKYKERRTRLGKNDRVVTTVEK